MYGTKLTQDWKIKVYYSLSDNKVNIPVLSLLRVIHTSHQVRIRTYPF